MENKQCIKCKKELELKSFYKDKRNYGGYRNVCKSCEGSIKMKPIHVTCISCNITKLFEDFPIWKNKCKECVKVDRIKSKRQTSSRLYFIGKDYIKVNNKICIKCHTNKDINEFTVRNDSSDGYRNTCKSCFNTNHNITAKIYRQINKKEIRRKDLIYRKNRMSTDTLYKAKITARNVIRKSLTKCGYTKNSHTFEILGCSYEEFKNHLESLFLPNMDWLNRHQWDIDHIIPLSFCENEEECLILNNYKNLRPIWRIDNQEKSGYITEETEIYYKILNNRNNI